MFKKARHSPQTGRTDKQLSRKGNHYRTIDDYVTNKSSDNVQSKLTKAVAAEQYSGERKFSARPEAGNG
jgi:hypothetical protein